MTILTVAQERVLLHDLTQTVGELYPDSQVLAYVDPMLAVKHAFNNPIDAVYSEVDMKRLTGFELLRLVRKKYPKLPVHLIASTNRYETAALRAAADSYTVVPITVEKLREAEHYKEWDW